MADNARTPSHRPKKLPFKPIRHDSALSIHEASATARAQSATELTPSTPPPERTPPPAPTPSALLLLPAEIRVQIYAALTPPLSRTSPLQSRTRTLGLSSVTHAPPPAALLATCTQLHAEAQAAYHAKAAWRLEGLLDGGNGWARAQVRAVLRAAPVLRRLRTLSLACFWHGLPGGEAGEVELRARRGAVAELVEVLRGAGALRAVVVGWGEGSGAAEGWEVKGGCLEPLRGLGCGVEVRVGEVVASEDVVVGLERFVRALNDRGEDGIGGGKKALE